MSQLNLYRIALIVLMCTVVALSSFCLPYYYLRNCRYPAVGIDSYAQIIKDELSAFPDNPLAFYLFNADDQNTILRFRIDGGKVAAESVGEQIKDGGYFILRNEEDMKRLNFVCIGGRGKVTAIFYPKRVEIK